MSMSDFLLARIAGDETNARSIENAEWFNGVDSDVEAEVCAFADPVRVLAECAAKRLVVGALEGIAGRDRTNMQRLDLTPEQNATYARGRDALRALASVYAAHPDYRQEWKP